MEMEKVLINLGLDDKQAKIYLALLQMGSGSVPSISVRSGIKRPTAYLILEELRQKELVNLIPRSTKIYTACSPQVLLEEENEKQAEIRAIMPELLALFNTKKEKPKITYYEGEESIVRLYDKIFKENEILFYGSIASISPGVYKQIEKYLEVIKKDKRKVREFLQADEKSIKFAADNASENHELKIAPKGYLFPTDNMIFGNKVAIVTYKETPQAVVIESTDVAATYRSIFEILWVSV
jgi:sugar-specific transcriptional regulator TrmB